MQMAEADPTMQDTVVAAMHRFAELMHTMLQNNNTGKSFHPPRIDVSTESFKDIWEPATTYGAVREITT